MSVEARVWKIWRRSATEVGADGPLLAAYAKSVEAVELEPVLDLLERLRSRNDLTDRADLSDLLRTHGRLK